MSAERVIKMPDVGEGIAEAELVEWHVRIGDPVKEDMVLAAVMTDKATVEIPSPVDGRVAWLGAEPGERISVGAPLIRLETVQGEGAAPPVEKAGEAAGEAMREPPATRAMAEQTREAVQTTAQRATPAASHSGASSASWSGAPRAEGEKPLASPAIRLRAREAGVDLRQVRGTGPAGRITHDDLDQFMRQGEAASSTTARALNLSVEETRIIGLRRRIAERMEQAHARIVPITYVEEVDVTELEALRGRLNAGRGGGQQKLTLLPLLMRALVGVLREHPRMNAHYEDEAGILRRFGGIHIGIAAQTDAGLVVPVLRHAEARGVWDLAAELSRLAAAARGGTATREELTGSTITITSLGSLGGIATTPVINRPEVAIIGVNRIATRPLWDGKDFRPREVMNLSSSFDHRVIDGWDAAMFIQRLKAVLETPALIFMDD